MGLASSQARLLLLTARKSDLEYRSQMISQRKIMLAMETEQLATDYTRALSKTRLTFVFDTDASTGQTMTEDLTYAGLTAQNTTRIGNFIVTDSQGRMVVPTDSNNQVVLPSGFQLVTDANGKQYAYYKGQDGVVNQSTDQRFEVNVCNDVLNADVFQNALKNGGLYLEKLNTTTDQYESKSWQSLDVIQDKMDTSDSSVAIAQSQYEAKSLTIQNQDKMLDLELKQIETQHKAIETEYDSVKKVIDKNIEVSYKIFANG